MKTLSLSVLVVSLLVAPVLAADGHVPGSTLASLGLGGMQVVSDAEGMQVRGQAWARVRGSSVIIGKLTNPLTDEVYHFSSTDAVDLSISPPPPPFTLTAQTLATTNGWSLTVNSFSASISGRVFGRGTVTITMP